MQKIYKSYIYVSDCLIKSIRRDINIPQTDYAIKKEEWNITVDTDEDLYLPGLICMLVKEIIKMIDG